MGRYPLNSSFTRQFRQEENIHFGAEAIPHCQLVFNTFGLPETEIRCLSNWLAPQLHDETIIHNLQDKLTNHDIPDAQRLYSFIQETNRELVAQAMEQPYPSNYYNHLITLLHSYLDLIDAFTRNGIQMISSSGYFTSDNSLSAGGEAVSNPYCIIEDYMYQIMEYFQHLDMLLQKESMPVENNARLLVKSYVAHYLETIMHHTEQVLSNTDSTLEMLHTWETTLLNREEQELYN